VTQTDSPRARPAEHAPRCATCRRRLTRRPGPGRPARFCSQACRQRAYLERTRAAEAAGVEERLREATQQLEALRDAADVLRRALADVERELAATGRPSPDDLARMLAWLTDAAREVTARP
jgi:hypothetical protein